MGEKALGILRNVIVKNKEIKVIVFKDNKIKEDRKEILKDMFFKLDIELILE